MLVILLFLKKGTSLVTFSFRQHSKAPLWSQLTFCAYLRFRFFPSIFLLSQDEIFVDPFIICFLTLVSAKMGTVICEYFLPFFSSQSQVLPSVDRIRFQPLRK